MSSPNPNNDGDDDNDDDISPTPSQSLSISPPLDRFGEQITNRPNRFTGPPSTWRSWTENERAVTTDIDKERAQDLSIHLYNAHALKKRKFTNDNDDVDRARKFTVPKVWTAWPMPANEVPREGENWGRAMFDDESIVRPPIRKDSRIKSAMLEECLTATVQREAASRFRQRTWTTDAPTIDSSRPTSDSEVDEVKKIDDGAKKYVKPVIMADDALAARILLPTTRSILSRFDTLLSALHTQRHAYANVSDQSESESASSAQSTPRKRPRQRSRSRAGSTTTDGPPSRPKAKQTRLSRLGLRDWSDVLGLAAMIGWDEDVLRRTAGRCRALFGEGMEFRVLREEEEGSGEEDEVWQAGEEQESEEEESVEEDQEEEQEEEEHPIQQLQIETPSQHHTSPPSSTPLSCPHPTCPRHLIPFSTPGTLSQHLGHAHNTTPDISSSQDTGDIRCPVRECWRHGKGFSRATNLTLHMKRMHPERVPGRLKHGRRNFK